MILSNLIEEIERADEKIACEARKKWDSIAHPLSSLGVLEEIIAKIASCERKILPETEKKAVAVFCADNGIVEEGVTQTSADVTAIVAENMCTKKTSVCCMAAVAGADVIPIDMGMKRKVFHTAMIDMSVRRGSSNFAKENAMTGDEVLRAIENGEKVPRELTTSAAVVCAMLGKRAEDVAGRGAGLTDAGLKRKIDVINRALTERAWKKSDVISILSAFGGFDIAGMCGFYLGMAKRKKCVLLDGFISQTAALCAVKLAENVRDYLIATHESSEKGSKMVLNELKMSGFIHAGLHLGEGTGAVCAFPMIEMAKKVYCEMATFDEISVEAYKR